MIKELVFKSFVACSWANPGHDPYSNTPEAALDQFTIPAEHRYKLAQKIRAGANDDVVFITKNGIEGAKDRNLSNFTIMTFGNNKLCYGIDTSKWKDKHFESAKLYCSDDWCVMVPAVCGNISQVFSRRSVGDAVDKKVSNVPEPASLWLFLSALVAFFKLKRK